MVRAILDGRKSMTRRVVKPQPIRKRGGWIWPVDGPGWEVMWSDSSTLHELELPRHCPYGRPGDRLYVRETWAETYNQSTDEEVLWYRADQQDDLFRAECERAGQEARWRPSIHMPRWASRLTLEIADVRVERLQAITEEDAAAEGIGRKSDSRREWFARLWDSLNKQCGHSWDANPYVWALSFRRVDP
jgi:hypothetical protein